MRDLRPARDTADGGLRFRRQRMGPYLPGAGAGNDRIYPERVDHRFDDESAARGSRRNLQDVALEEI
jgi:hypothetical protein